MNHKIVNTARSWVSTPFKHQGRLKGIGCDCLGLVMGIANELGLRTTSGRLIAELDRADYHMISSGIELKQKLDDNLEALETLKLGALALLEFDTDTQHLAIISDNQVMGFNLIHADLSKRMVVEHNLSDGYIHKIKGVYKLSSYNTSIPHTMFKQILTSPAVPQDDKLWKYTVFRHTEEHCDVSISATELIKSRNSNKEEQWHQ